MLWDLFSVSELLVEFDSLLVSFLASVPASLREDDCVFEFELVSFFELA